MTTTDVDPTRFYIVEKRIADISVLPFGFLTDEDACSALLSFPRARRAGMFVCIGSRLGEVKDDFLGKRVT